MSRPPYRGLSIGLRVVSALIALGGMFAMLSGKPLILRAFMHPPAAELSTLLLAMVKELGGVMVMMSVMLFLAARDPARNVAIFDGLIVGLCVLSITALLSVKMLEGIYPAYLIWGKAVVRLALAAVLFYARPRGTLPAQ